MKITHSKQVFYLEMIIKKLRQVIPNNNNEATLLDKSQRGLDSNRPCLINPSLSLSLISNILPAIIFSSPSLSDQHNNHSDTDTPPSTLTEFTTYHSL